MRLSRTPRSTLVPLALGCLLVSSQARADGADSWVVASAGVFNIAAEEHTPEDTREPEVGLEWRGRERAFGLRFNLGAMVHAEGGGYLFAGLRRDFDLSERLGLSLGFGAGAFEKGDGVDLGGAVEFRSSIEMFARLSERSRLGIDFYHLSNAGIYDLNPGSNSLILVYGHRID